MFVRLSALALSAALSLGTIPGIGQAAAAQARFDPPATERAGAPLVQIQYGELYTQRGWHRGGRHWHRGGRHWRGHRWHGRHHWRRHHWRRHHWAHRPWRHRHYGSHWPIVPFIGAGAFFNYYDPGPIYVAPRYRYRHRVRASSAHYDWCHARYRSYRAWDNTFQPYHGPRRQCISPYM